MAGSAACAGATALKSVVAAVSNDKPKVSSFGFILM
jgi:hypothetical protein